MSLQSRYSSQTVGQAGSAPHKAACRTHALRQKTVLTAWDLTPSPGINSRPCSLCKEKPPSEQAYSLTLLDFPRVPFQSEGVNHVTRDVIQTQNS